MGKNLRFAYFALGSILVTGILQAQNDKFAYAVTDLTKEGINWSYLRKVDLSTGNFSDVLLAGNDVTNLAHDASSKKQFTAPIKDARYGNVINAAFGTGVAAVALDKRHNRLYYTPMFIDQLRYIDLSTMKVYYVTGSDFTGMSKKAPDQSNIITRMTIGDDGNGYALTNDGTNLIQFTTGKKLTVTNLGRLIDAPENKSVSVHNSCTSYGGDMIADNDGNLYILSTRNHVFRINIESKVATHLGSVTGLPSNFTINGAAVDDKNQVVITSATTSSPVYTLDVNSLVAKQAGEQPAWRCSDLANSNILQTRKPVEVPELMAFTEATRDDRIALYPNPVIGNQFNVQFNTVEAGNYTVQVTDTRGLQVAQKQVNVSGKGQTLSQVTLNSSSAKGIYIVKVMDNNSRMIYTNKILLQ